MKAASWIIVELSTGNAVCELYTKTTVEKINNQKYKAVPVMEYLQSISKPKN